MTIPLCIKRSAWPGIDQNCYSAAREFTSFLDSPKPALRWSAARCRNIEQGYGQWLSFLARNGWLDTKGPPEARVTRDRVRLFVTQLQGRVSSWSVSMIFEGFARMVIVTAPERDWTWLRTAITNLKANAKPERDKRSHMVDARQLLALGIDLMDQAVAMGDRYHAAACMRDGLLIAILASCPIMRLANLTAIETGRHLLADCGCYRLVFTEQETKTAHPYQAELSSALSHYVDIWLRDHRRRLLRQGSEPTTNRLWIDRWGKPMRSWSIRTQIEKRTFDAFGRHIWPHLFRSIAATSFVDHDPDKVTMVSDLLGHRAHQTAHKHYILAEAARSHRAVNSAFEERRSAAFARLNEQKGGGHAP